MSFRMYRAREIRAYVGCVADALDLCDRGLAGLVELLTAAGCRIVGDRLNGYGVVDPARYLWRLSARGRVADRPSARLDRAGQVQAWL
jgi:hypothetical protein